MDREKRGKGRVDVALLLSRERERYIYWVPRQETQLGVLGTPSTTIYTVKQVQYLYDIMGYKLP
jgi:hypothetical protein